MIRALIAIVGLALATLPAKGERMLCAPAAQLMPALIKNMQLVEIGHGHLAIDPGGLPAGVYAGPGGQWFVILFTPTGLACFRDSGEGWQFSPPPPPGKPA